MAFNTGGTDVDRAPSMCTTDDAWRTDMFSCWHCQRARHSLGSAQNCPGPIGLQRILCTLGAKDPTDDNRVHCMGLYGPFLFPLDMLHWSKRAGLELKHVKLCKTWNQKNDVWWRNYHLPSAKKNACFGFPWLWWHCLWIVTLSLGQLFFTKDLDTSPKYCPFAWKCQAAYTQMDSCLWL